MDKKRTQFNRCYLSNVVLSQFVVTFVDLVETDSRLEDLNFYF